MKRYFKFFASILLVLYFTSICCAQTKIDWKQIKNIPDTLDFKNVLLEHLLFKAAYQPVLDPAYRGAIYYDNSLERLRIYENGEWRDMSVTIASDSIGAPLTILGYLQASDIYASRSAYIGKDVNVKGGVFASGTSILNSLKVNNTLKIPTTASTTLGVGSIYYNPTTKKLNILNSSNQWDPISIEVDSVLSATSTNPVQNKVITAAIGSITASLTYNVTAIDNQIKQVNINMLASLSAGLNAVEASTTAAINTASSALDAQFNAEISSYSNTLKSYIDAQDFKTLASASSIIDDYVYNVQEGDNNGTIKVTRGFQNTNVKVHGLGDAAFTNVASISSSIGGNIPARPSTPSNPSEGQMYYDTGTHLMYYWNGSAWIALPSQLKSYTNPSYPDQQLLIMGNLQIIIGGPSGPGTINFIHPFATGSTPGIAFAQSGSPFNLVVSALSDSQLIIGYTGYESTTSAGDTTRWIAVGWRSDTPITN